MVCAMRLIRAGIEASKKVEEKRPFRLEKFAIWAMISPARARDQKGARNKMIFGKRFTI
jgi:hypothetical protein